MTGFGWEREGWPSLLGRFSFIIVPVSVLKIREINAGFLTNANADRDDFPLRQAIDKAVIQEKITETAFVTFWRLFSFANVCRYSKI